MNNDFLAHHGIQGQKWGVRRYQYQDGSLTPEGKRRYGTMEVRNTYNKAFKESFKKNEASGKRFIESYKLAGKEAADKTLKLVGKTAYDKAKNEQRLFAIVAGAAVAMSIARTIQWNQVNRNINFE